MLNLSREETIKEHQKMWKWIAEETLRTKMCIQKYDYFFHNKFENNEKPSMDCFCCDYALRFLNPGERTRKSCNYCPLQWHKNCCYEGEYDLWNQACLNNDYTNAAKLAVEIAELPEKEEK